VQTAGENGIRTIVYRVTYDASGNEIGREEVSSTITKAAVEEVIERGTKPKVTTTEREERVTEAIPYTTRTIDNPDLEEGTTRVQTAGENGIRTIVYRVTYDASGNEIGREEVSSTITKAAVEEVIERGTKPKVTTTEREERVTEAIPYTTRTIDNPDLEEGTTRVQTAGENGIRTIVYRVTYDASGNEIGREEVSSTITKAAVEEVIERGTKPKVTTTEREERVTEAIPYTTRTIDNPDLEEGTTRVQTAGENGIRTIVYRVTYDASGNEIGREEVSSTITKAAVEEVIERGTKPKVTTTEREERVTEAIPYTTRTIDNPDLEEGTTRVQTAGENGIRTIVYRVTYDASGNEIGREEVSSTITKAAVEEVIERGTKSKVNKDELIRLINDANNQDSSLYSFDSWNNLQQSLQQSISILNNTNATQNQVDQATSELQHVLSNLELLKTVPVVALNNIAKDINNRTINVSYNVEDTQHTIQNIKVNIYKNQNLEQTKNLNLDNYTVMFNGLNYNTNYIIETVITYNIGTEHNTVEILASKAQFELTPKKIELKNIKSINLYKLDGNQLNRIVGLSSLPDNSQNYMVKISSENNKDIILPVSSFSEVSDQNKYKVNVSYPELVTYNYQNNTFTNNYSFLIDKISSEQGIYTNFKDLVDAININPSGDFIIGANLSANEVRNNTNSYVTSIFTGTLSSKEGNVFSIYNLEKPLFDTVNNGVIRNINLLDVAISGHYGNVGSLARTVTEGTISNIHVTGNISTGNSVGGLIYNANQRSRITNVSYSGSISITGNMYHYVGGLIGFLDNNSVLDKSYADIVINVVANTTNEDVGGLVGQANNNSFIRESYVKGKINSVGQALRVGGIIGSAWWYGHLENVISFVSVNAGNLIHGDTNYTNPPFQNVYYVENFATGNPYDVATTKISLDRAKELIKSWRIPNINYTPMASTVDYSTLTGYEYNREIAYHNIEKLLPFYDRYTIIRYGNLVNSNNRLYSTKLLSVLPLNNGNIVANPFSNKNRINKLLLYYVDGSIEKINIISENQFLNTRINEFTLENGLVYTPMQFESDYSDIINQVQTTFDSINLLSRDMLIKLGLLWTDSELITAENNAIDNYRNQNPGEIITLVKEQELRAEARNNLETEKYNQIKDMYLTESFTNIKNNIVEYLIGILTNGAVIDVDSFSSTVIKQFMVNKINNHSLDILLGLSYINRLYDIDFGTTNIKNIMMYRPDFYGKSSNTLDWIISLGNMGYESLKVKNNYNTYSSQISSFTGIIDLIDFLDKNRKLFSPEMDENTWFKSSTKAYIHEVSSIEVPNAIVQIYPRLKGIYRKEYRNFILPLLNLKDDDVFIVTNMSTITFGLYERYIDEALKSDISVYKERVQEFHNVINRFADMYAVYYDTWYRIADDNVKNQLLTRDIPVWDGYWIIDNTQSGYWKNRWVSKYDETIPAMTEFFGAIGKWYAPNGVGAYANGSLVHFVVDAVVTEYGTSTLTHEMTHNFDGNIYLNGYGRREGQGAENFATGLLQVPSNSSDKIYGLNLIFDWSNKNNRVHNATPSEFQNDSLLQKYMHGVFDVTYILDYLEAEASLEKNKEDQKLIYRKLIFDSTNSSDRVITFTDDEWNSIQLNNIYDLIDNNIISKRYYGNASVGRNSYYSISLFAPIYAGIENNNGTMGGIVFRKTAFELLAAKGWDDGFVPYTSNQYRSQAVGENKVFSDSYIFNKIFNDDYSNYAEFKKAMFNERIQKKNYLKHITIQWANQTFEINTYDDLLNLFRDAVTRDLELTKSNRNEHFVDDLKCSIFQQYQLLTHDFSESIFNI
ncbi:ZmpA/ZmpB/ZmpC family metallo-endopeptidase, partial [Enterococcus sp. DIV0765f]|uniref:ZmpA/ZmpB/ZmpC family metallo-endopeptidase n=1 Tax=Enterococcus sp. DIV0765f TaxID=2774783 RepID=UPI003F683353